MKEKQLKDYLEKRLEMIYEELQERTPSKLYALIDDAMDSRVEDAVAPLLSVIEYRYQDLEKEAEYVKRLLADLNK